MKRVGFSLVIVLLLSGAIVAAENPIDKGSLILDGSVSFMSQGGDLYKDTADNSVTIIGITPSVGYFIAPSIMVGGEVSLLSTSQGDYSSTNWAIGPMAGYYFNIDPARTEVKGAIYPYIKAFFLYGQNKFDVGTLSTTTNVVSYGGRGGAVFMLSSAVGVDANVLFLGESYKPEGADQSTTGTSFGVSAGITAFIF